jgi:hypothetical protein
VLVRGGTDEKTGEALSATAVAERVGWCATLVQGMAGLLAAGHWNPGDLETLASGEDGTGRPLPAQAWMGLRRLGWAAVPPDGVKVNDRVARMAQELAGRLLRSALWRDALTAAVTSTWPADDPDKRTAEEWDAVRAAAPGGDRLPSPVIRARTRQAARYLKDHGRLPAGVTELEAPPAVPAMLVLAACDKQQAVIERHEADPRRVLLRLQLPSRPDPRGPTPRRSTARRAPGRRTAPSPPRAPGHGGQRPEGHAHTAQALPRAATRDQRVNATCTQPARRPHKARGAALGAGFHRNAHATPPQREPDPQHHPASTG